MEFVDRITRLPHAFDPDFGRDARAIFPELTGDLARLVEGAGGCSPYLSGLMQKETAWILTAFEGPEAAIKSLFADLCEVPPDQLPNALRQGKRRVALLSGLCDLAGVWALEDVTGVLTDFADLATDLAMKACIGAEIRRGKLPGMGEDDLAYGAGMVALGMGKMGAHELNYSSDIDLICLFDESRFEVDDFHEARSSFVRATRRMAAMLSDMTGEGYVFRTDLRLRPDPAVTPVCVAMEAAMRYYESLGRTWERAAYIKARPAAGDLVAGAKFLKGLRPFVWRKHLDFAAIEDAHNMRLRIRAHKKLGREITLPGHNMKLGRGGIREIEFFTQTRQIIAGGRDPDLRLRGTVESLAVLAKKGWLPETAADVLTQRYRWFREVEHRLQMVNDAQTHDLPKSPEGMARIACFMGVELADLERDLTMRLGEVHELTESFFTSEAPEIAEQSEFDSEVISRWRSYPALRSERAVKIFSRLKPEILRRLHRAAKPDEALLAFDGFLAGLPAGVQLFSLFEANPQLIDLLVDIVGTSAELARHLSRNSAVFDAVIGGDFFAPWPGIEALIRDLEDVLSGQDDYESKLDSARRWAKEWHFRIGVHHLRGLIDAQTAGAHYGDLAEAVLRGIWPVVVAQFASKHGPAPGRGASVLAMGSLGAGRLNTASDLDLIVIYDADGVENSDGRRPLGARVYYARLTQALITALSAQMSEGRLYEVDMRLRPSGNTGPVATSLQSFKDYQEKDAWVWEHLALTRARVMVGDVGLGQDIEAFRCEVIARHLEPGQILKEVREMRLRIADAKAPDGLWDAKIGAGRMQDIELLSQAACLMAGAAERDVSAGLAAGVAIGWLNDVERATLQRSYDLCWRVQSTAKLLSNKALDPSAIGKGGCDMIMRETGQVDLAALKATLEAAYEAASAAIEAALNRLPTGAEA